MSWILLLGLVLALGIAFLTTLSRRAELARMEQHLQQRARADRSGAGEALLQFPVVDLSRCLGCGTCVAACPEEGVLELVHGQAVVVNGARCVGHSACERECPVGAIQVTIANLEQRTDVPVVSAELESVSAPGLFLAGEVTAHALVKTAIEQGTAAARAAAARRDAAQADASIGEFELCIVGAGPAGLACALEAKRLGLAFVVIEQEEALGGTVARYPRRKLVLTQPVELPLHGPLGGGRTTFTKEELIALWLRIAREEELPIHCGVAFQGCERRADGGFTVHTSGGPIPARQVCLALGRRGSPRNALCGRWLRRHPRVAAASAAPRAGAARSVVRGQTRLHPHASLPGREPQALPDRHVCGLVSAGEAPGVAALSRSVEKAAGTQLAACEPDRQQSADRRLWIVR